VADPTGPQPHTNRLGRWATSVKGLSRRAPVALIGDKVCERPGVHLRRTGYIVPIMQVRVWLAGWLMPLSMCGCSGWLPSQRSLPPPDVRRPQVKSEAELAAEREARIQAGQVIPTSTPAVLSAEGVATARAASRILIQPTAGAIQGDLLIINNFTLSVEEVLYPLQQQLAELRRTRTEAGFMEEARRLIRRRAQEAIGSILIYAEAVSRLDKEQLKLVEEAVDKEWARLLASDFGGSAARLAAYLKECGLTKEQLREDLKRSIVVRQYTREKLMPQVQIRRDELLTEYRRNLPRYSTPETRELLLIEVPFEKLLAGGQSWDRASPAERAQAKLKAMERVRQAQAALAEKPFEEVAREHSLGLHAEAGGSWGMIARPLQPPYDAVSKPIFEFQEGQVSEPIETPTGWYIVKCGRIAPASQRPFVEVQEEIRRDLAERRFAKLSVDYIMRLAEKATISSLDSFVDAAVRRARQVTATASGRD